VDALPVNPVAGLDPATHVFADRRYEVVDAHGTSPWAEGQRDTPGRRGDHGGFG
jgi:hypothetical protein